MKTKVLAGLHSFRCLLFMHPTPPPHLPPLSAFLVRPGHLALSWKLPSEEYTLSLAKRFSNLSFPRVLCPQMLPSFLRLTSQLELFFVL